MSRIIFHLDMDAFFAAIEQRERPELVGRAVVVGSPPSRRGVVAAASYEARRYGVRSAMPSSVACRLCPHAVFVPSRMDLYRAESAALAGIIDELGALSEWTSIDEAYLDVSPLAGEGDPDERLRASLPLARSLKSRIQKERGLTATIGVAANKLLAKLASGYQKPDGLTLIPERDKVQFLRPLPVRAIHGVGETTEQLLKEHGCHTVGDLQDATIDLVKLLGVFGRSLQCYAFGDDPRPVVPEETVKQISSEHTFEQDTRERQTLRACLREQAADVAGRLHEAGLEAHTVQVKVRYPDFTTLSRQLTLDEPVREADDLYRVGGYLLSRWGLVQRPVRLLGLGVGGLVEASGRQLVLPFDSETRRGSTQF